MVYAEAIGIQCDRDPPCMTFNYFAPEGDSQARETPIFYVDLPVVRLGFVCVRLVGATETEWALRLAVCIGSGGAASCAE